ncbi:hypothetical protein DFH11DRAFT_246195 [Phellopilus nigrolimitatus]|nr:hypothetical protein DFH11DRAFT_246195 [Phellopilus nigrolimitatus]
MLTTASAPQAAETTAARVRPAAATATTPVAAAVHARSIAQSTGAALHAPPALHHAPGVGYYPSATLQGPNIPRAHRPSCSWASGASIPGARRRSVSRSSSGRSWSIDEMLHETATDREGRKRRRWRLVVFYFLCKLREKTNTDAIYFSQPASHLTSAQVHSVSRQWSANTRQPYLRRCRKKMKRVKRCGTMDSVSASQQAQMIAHRSSHPALVHSQSQNALAHSSGQSQHVSVGRAHATARQDTLLVDHHTGRTQTQSQMLSPRPVSHCREHDRDQENRGGSSRSHSGLPVSASASAVASRRLHPAESAHLSQGQTYPSASANMNTSGLGGQNAHRRLPTPPYINSISTREQYANGSSSRALPHQHSQSHTRTAAAVTGGAQGAVARA